MDDIEGTKSTYCRTLTLDVDYYQKFLDDADISESKKQELIETLWNIVVQFVDLGFGIHPLQQAKDTHSAQGSQALARLVADMAREEFHNKKEILLEGETT